MLLYGSLVFLSVFFPSSSYSLLILLVVVESMNDDNLKCKNTINRLLRAPKHHDRYVSMCQSKVSTSKLIASLR